MLNLHNMILEDDMICHFFEGEMSPFVQLNKEEKRTNRKKIRNREVNHHFKAVLIEYIYERY